MVSPINVDTVITEMEAFMDRVDLFTYDVERGLIDPISAAAAHEEITPFYQRIMADMEVLRTTKVALSNEFAGRIAVVQELYAASERTLAVYRGVLMPEPQPAPMIQTPTPAPRLLHVPVTVFYRGKGQLFIRGIGATIAPPPCGGAGRTTPPVGENLRWEEGVVLPQIADYIYQTTLVVPEGTRAEYKISRWDVFCSGANYSTDGTAPAIHFPTFDRMSTLSISLNVGYGNKLAIFGEGILIIEDDSYVLDWKEGIELSCLKSDLWALGFIRSSPEVIYKIAIVKEDGSIVKWEEGPNRRLEDGTEYVLLPNLGIAPGPRSDLHDFTVAPQAELLAGRAVQDWQAAAAKANRERPNFTTAGSIFGEGEVLRVHDFVRIEPLILDGQEFLFGYNAEGRSVVMQQGLEGCSAGTAAMLIIDNKKLPSRTALTTRTAASHNMTAEDIMNAGLTPILTQVASLHNSLEELRNQILLHGSASIAIKETNAHGTGHVVVIDEIAADLSTVRLRDPWHNWDITVDGAAFARWWRNRCDTNPEGIIIQVRQP